MLWPQSVFVRMNPVQAKGLLEATAACTDEEIEIAEFPEYGTKLNASQQTRLDAIAALIVRSHDSQSPVTGIAIVGHADRALRIPADQRAAKELDVSVERAVHAQEMLVDKLEKTPGGQRVLAMVHMLALGKGSKELKHPNPTPQEMIKNRRVVFKWSRCQIPMPRIIHPRLEFPRPEYNPEDDPNVVFAGTRFRMKILDGFAAGEIGGVFSYHIAIWDVDNMRLAEYLYSGVILTVGVPPFTECGESTWSNIFTTDSHVQVDQFSGEGSHEAGSIGLASGLRYSFKSFSDATVRIQSEQASVFIYAGPSKSLAAEGSLSGRMSLQRGSVRVFKGPL